MKKQPTAAQKEAAAARRAEMKKLAKEIAKLSEAERIALAESFGGITTIAGHSLSLHNVCMLTYQRKNITVVGGFRQWKKAGRSVMKGEHGLSIWVPCNRKKDDGDAGSEGDADSGKVFFSLGTVFDISQTQELTPKTKPEPVQAPAFEFALA